MATPTQNQNKNPQASNQDQTQSQGRKDDMHNTGAQAKASKDADKGVQQRKDAPKPGQNH